MEVDRRLRLFRRQFSLLITTRPPHNSAAASDTLNCGRPNEGRYAGRPGRCRMRPMLPLKMRLGPQPPRLPFGVADHLRIGHAALGAHLGNDIFQGFAFAKATR